VTALDLAASVLLLAGAAFVLLATAGLWRFDDLFSRIHAATKAITLGVLLVIAGTALRMEQTPDLLKLLLAAVLQLISAPVAGHMLARAAYWAGMQSTTHTVVDHLRDVDLDK
jgi:multicomponent Na+:H+ antiporter subunit G